MASVSTTNSFISRPLTTTSTKNSSTKTTSLTASIHANQPADEQSIVYQTFSGESLAGGPQLTLQQLLEPFAVHGEMFALHYEAVGHVASRAFGEMPSAFHTYAIYPATVKCQVLCFFLMNESKKLSQTLVRISDIVTSLVAQCAYCSATACGLGDVFKGSVSVKSPLRLSPKDVSASDKVVLRLCVDATKLPARVLPKTREEIRKIFGGVGLQQIGNIVAAAGFKNSLNALLTCEIDEFLARNAEVAFKNTTGFTFGAHKFNFRFQTTFKKRHKHQSFFSCIKNSFELLKQTRILHIDNQSVLKALPSSSHKSLDGWLFENFHGFTPRYLSKIISLETKRLFCGLLHQAIFTTNPQQSLDARYTASFDLSDKAVLAFVYFSGTSNNLLKSHFAYLAHSLGVSAQALLLAVKYAKTFNHKLPGWVETAMDVMIPLVYYTARRYHKRMWRLSPQLLRVCDNDDGGGSNPATVLAFCTFAGVLTLLQRYSAVVDDGEGFEEVVAKFVRSAYGIECGLDLEECCGTTSSDKFFASEEELDIDWDDVDVNILAQATASLRMGVGKIIGREELWGGHIQY